MSVADCCATGRAAQSDLKRARTDLQLRPFDEAIERQLRGAQTTWRFGDLIIARSRSTVSTPAIRRAATVGGSSVRESDELAPQEATSGRSDWVLRLLEQRRPGAESFRAVIPSRGRLDSAEFEKLIEWWGSTMSRLSRDLKATPAKAYDGFERTEARAERNPSFAPATYWMGFPRAAWRPRAGPWSAAAPDGLSRGAGDGRQLRSESSVRPRPSFQGGRSRERGQRIMRKPP